MMPEQLKPYSHYKNSGVEWLGQLPLHWGVRASKWMFRQSRERAWPEDEQLSATQAYGVIRQKDYEQRIGRKVVRILNHLDKRKHVEKDDFVISMRSFQGGLERAWCRGAIRSSYVVLKAKEHVHVPYFAHLFKSQPYIHALRRTSEFIRDGQDLTFWNFAQVPLPVVPLDEQEAIAKYLDLHAAKVHRFIRNRRRLIELLNEQKQAIITHAVTRGLDPSVPLKPSGLDWLGDVPKHWQVFRLRNLAELHTSNVDKHTKPGELPVRLCNYTDVYKNDEITADMPFMTATASPDEIRAFRLQVGDVLITKDSEDWKDIGVPAVVLSTADDLVCGYHLAILRPRPQMISGPFLSLALRSQASTAQLSVSAKGVTRFGLSQGAIKDLLIATPPQDEQQRIIQYVHAKTKTLRHAIEQASREVDLIREYRTRLIADVVTGKVDVRHLAAELGDEPELDEGGFASVEADADVEELDEVMEEAADVDD